MPKSNGTRVPAARKPRPAQPADVVTMGAARADQKSETRDELREDWILERVRRGEFIVTPTFDVVPRAADFDFHEDATELFATPGLLLAAYEASGLPLGTVDAGLRSRSRELLFVLRFLTNHDRAPLAMIKAARRALAGWTKAERSIPSWAAVLEAIFEAEAAWIVRRRLRARGGSEKDAPARARVREAKSKLASPDRVEKIRELLLSNAPNAPRSFRSPLPKQLERAREAIAGRFVGARGGLTAWTLTAAFANAFGAVLPSKRSEATRTRKTSRRRGPNSSR